MRRSSTLFKIRRGLRSILARKAFAAEVVRHSEMPIRSGLWVLGPTFSTRRGTRLPAPLSGSKLWLDFQPTAMFKLPIRLAGAMLPPWFAWRTPRKTDQAGAQVLLVNRVLMPVAFDLKKGAVIRSVPHDEAAELLRKVGMLRSAYECPNLDYDHELSLLHEEFIAGTPYRRVPLAFQDACLSGLTRRVAGARRGVLADADRAAWLDASRRLLAEVLPTESEQLAARVAAIVSDTPTGWIHGDMAGENIILRGAEPVLIDFDRVMLGPLFFDPLHLLLIEASLGNPAQLRAFFRGAYDDALATISLPARGDADRSALCVAAVGWKLSRAMTSWEPACELLGRTLAEGLAFQQERPAAPVAVQFGTT